MHRLPVNIFKIRRFLKNLCVWYLIFFFSFGQVGMVFAQEATQSALLRDISIPKLRLPFDGVYARGLGFTDKYTDQKIIDSLGDIAQQGHDGVDFALPEGTPVYVVDDGEVVIAGESDFGITVKIDHAWGSSVYGHLKETKVIVGQKVSALNHDVIGLSGATGVTEGPHLHFGIKPKQLNGEKEILGFIDPASYMDIASLPVYNPTASVSAQLLPGNIATVSAIASQSASQDVLGATLPQAENIATDSAYLFNYKFDLDKGTTAHFYDKETKRPSFAIADENYNYKLRFFLEGENDSTPKVDGNKLEFPVIVKGIPMTLRYTIDQNKVKEEFIIAEKPSDEILKTLGDNLQISFAVESVGLTQQYKNGEYIFTSKDGTVVWRILAPTVEDSANRKGTNEEVSLAVDDTKAVLGVSTAFLKEAAYPVIIDPTWTQSDWSGGSGTSTSTQYSSSSSVTAGSGTITLTNSEKLTNTSFATNLTGWNTGQQPSAISGLTVWIKADAITGKNDGDSLAAANILDQSGNSNNASSITGTLTYKTGIQNSMPVIRFPGTSKNRIDIPGSINIRSQSTGFVVFKTNTPNTWQALFSKDSNDLTFLQWIGTGPAGLGIHKSGVATIAAENVNGSGNWQIADYTYDSSGNGVVYRDGTQVATGARTGLDNNATLHIGLDTASQATGSFNGDMAEVIIFNSALSAADRSRVENYLRDKYNISVNTGITSATRDTTTKYSSNTASAKLITSGATGEFTQNVNVGDTGTYNISAYAYTDGSAVTSSDVQLFYNGSTVSTTYTSAGSGWYQLTGTVTGANATRTYGVQVTAGKTVYLDNMSVNNYASSGTLTSAIFDTSRGDYGTLSYTATTPSNTSVSVKARSSSSSTMSGATDFSSCTAIASGAALSTGGCVTNSDRYIQYQITLTNSDAVSTPTFQDVSITYTKTVPVAPSSLSGSAAGTTSITWSWTDNSSDEDGFYVQDTSGNTKCTVSSANTTTCTETGLAPNTSYTRNVVAYNSGGNSSASSNASATTRQIPEPSLSSPAEGAYLNTDRPSFRFQTPTSNTASKTYTDVSSYKLTISNTDSTYITISGIPISRTTDYETSTYTAHYEGFSDSDITNNYITVYTKTSSAWSSTSNDGKAKEGKNSWHVASVDASGNESTSSRDFYADYTSPVISNLSLLNKLGQKDGYLILTDETPTITGIITDALGLDKVSFAFIKEYYLLGTMTSVESLFSQSYTLTASDSTTSFSFTQRAKQSLGFGSFQIDVTFVDKAGNTVTSRVKAKVMTAREAELLLNGNIPPEEKQSAISLKDLEKYALLRREKEAAQLQQFITALNQEMGMVGDFLASIYTQTAEYIVFAWTNTATFLAQGITESTEIAMDISDTLKSGSQRLFTGLNRSIDSSQEVLVRQIRKEYVGVTDSITDNGNNAIASIVGGIENTREAIILTSTRIANAAISSVATAMKVTGQSIQESGQSLLGAVGEGIKLSDSGLQSVNTALSQSQEQTQKQIVLLNQATSQNLQKAGEAAGVAWRSLIKPAVETKNFADRVAKGATIALSTFQAYVFDQNPTKIAKVTIEELGSDYVVVSWETNHFTNSNVVNYGDSLSYGNKAWAPDGETYHKVKLTKLEPGKRYFFEVMSQNKNYAYDAYYSFETKK